MRIKQLTIQATDELANLNRAAATAIMAILLISLSVNLLVYALPVRATVEATENEQLLIAMTNQERKDKGLPELVYSAQLQEAARTKAYDMLDQDYFAHVSPQARKPWDFIKDTGYAYMKAGENLAIDYGSVTAPIAAWMASPSHRANMLKEGYEEIGIAQVTGEFEGRQTTVVVQMFGTKQFSTIPLLRLVGR